ncbi:FAD-dependent thymidylate synthase [Glaciecola punicea]|uniref:FAD-dependent thymidylate synthase n=1 Tax=Glaciecola punicea TaxID=56804 RepID=UPI000B0C4E61|nr:FAD-dependent thymidylate synthase [Glaciecola punicea]
MNNIGVTIIAHSVNPQGNSIATVELEYPRMIHAELMTHRVFSRNAASSRAIPTKKMREQVRKQPAMPVYWGANQPGMKAKAQLTGKRKTFAIWSWKMAGKVVANMHWCFEKIGLHKQIANRILEPWQIMKTVITATEWDNAFWLRCHEDAQPEIRELFEELQRELEHSQPIKLEWGGWHLPYVTKQFFEPVMPIENQLAVSASCCAQVSYRRNDASLTKAKKIDNMLRTSERIHASPFEHQAQAVLPNVAKADRKDSGFTHIDFDGHFWSGNFKHWVQHRQLIPNSNYTK